MTEKQPKSPASAGGASPRPPLSPASKAILIAIVAVLVLSIVARAMMGGEGGSTPASDGESAQVQGSSFLPGQQPTGGEGANQQEAPAGGLESALPYITEGSFFALLGFAVGYAAKKFLKIGLIVLAVFFVGLQVLSYMDVISVDWSRAVEVLDKFVLNLKENQTVTEVLKDRLPSAGAFLAAWFVGFRSG